jgi:ribose-phosphate pyrophosphokinase
MVVIGNTVGTERLASFLKSEFVLLEQEIFPDGETAMNLSVKEVPAGSLVDWRFCPGESIDAQILRLVSLLRCVRGSGCVNLLMSYFPYARSLPWREGLVVSSAEPMLWAIKNKVSQLFVVDLHCERGVLQSYLGGVRVLEVSVRAELADFIKSKLGSVVLVAPDRGSEGRVRHLSSDLGVEYLVMDKKRVSAADVRVKMSKENVEPEKLHVIIDDIVSTGGTLKAAISCLQDHGVNKIACLVTHNVAREDTLDSFAEAGVPIYTSNSLGQGDAEIDVVDSIVEVIGEQVKQV